jgi:hypothetical protein
MSEREEIKIVEEIGRYVQAHPFIPFSIVLTSGDRYEITAPLQVAVGKSIVIVVPEGERHSVLRQNQIAAIDVHAPTR